jgi:hypothetical protein
MAYEVLDGEGACRACGDVRRLYRRGDVELCAPCTVIAAVKALSSPEDAAKHVRQVLEQRRATLARNQVRRERLKAAGLCIDCGTEPALPTALRGETCNAKHISRQHTPIGGRPTRVRRWL